MREPPQHTFEGLRLSHVEDQHDGVHLVEVVLRDVAIVLLACGVPHNNVDGLVLDQHLKRRAFYAYRGHRALEVIEVITHGEAPDQGGLPHCSVSHKSDVEFAVFTVSF